MPPLFQFNQGTVTARDRAELTDGEMQVGTGGFYRKGDPINLHKIHGKTSFGSTGTGAKVWGLAVAQFDSGGQDQVLAASSTTLYKATPGASGTFATSGISLNASATHLTVAHSADRHYIGDGYSTNQVLESDGTTRNMGMEEPVEKPVGTATAGAGSRTRPNATVSNSGWTDPGNTFDSSAATFGYASLSAAGTATLVTSFAAQARTGKRISVKYGLAGGQFLGDSDDFEFGHGGKVEAGWDVTIKIELSHDAGVTYDEVLLNETALRPIADTVVLSASTDVNDDQLRLRYTFTYNTGTKTATFRVYDSYAENGATGAAVSTTTGLRYAVTEYDQTRGLESAAGPFSELVTLSSASSHNSVSLTLPSAALNATTTHFHIYRTTDGGTAPQDLARIGVALVAAAGGAFLDNLSVPITTVGAPFLGLWRVEDSRSNSVYFPRDLPPPEFQWMAEFKGSLLGIRRQDRALYMSAPGRPESWPEINVVGSFPFKEHDILVAAMPVGDALLIAAQDLMLRLDDIPIVVRGVFNAAEVHRIDGAPGCVSQYAITPFSVAGEPRVAWVSRFGVHVTNGYTHETISLDVDWPAFCSRANLNNASLFWDEDEDVLILDYPTSTTGNNRSAYIHMGLMHRKQNGQPKWTFPHHSTVTTRAGAVVGGEWRVYEADWSDGVVYLTGGTTDASQSFSGTQVPLDVTTGRLYGERRDTSVTRAGLEHGNFGSGQNATLTWTAGRDSASNNQRVSKTVSLNGQQHTEFFVGRAGQWHEVRIQHTGSARSFIKGIWGHGDRQGESGKVIKT